MKFLVVLLAAVVVLGALGAVMASIKDFRTERLTETFAVETSSLGTTANVSLAKGLWESSVANAEASSNITGDAPAITTYTSASKQLLVSGLAANSNRTLTVEYDAQGLAEYTGAEEGVKYLPTALVVGLILIPFGLIITVLVKKLS